MTFDHLAYLVRNTARSIEDFRPFFPEITLLRKSHDPQGVYITYMFTADGKMCIELVEPFEGNILLTTKLDRERRDCLPYHICMVVDDFEAEYDRLRQHGWITLTPPFEAFSGTKASHLFKPTAGIVEILGKK